MALDLFSGLYSISKWFSLISFKLIEFVVYNKKGFDSLGEVEPIISAIKVKYSI